VRLSRRLPRERAERNDQVILNHAEPSPSELITRACHPNGAVWTPPTFIGLPARNHFDKKGIGARCANARQFPSAMEFGIIGLPRIASKGEHHGVFRFTADLGHRAGPRPGDIGSPG